MLIEDYSADLLGKLPKYHRKITEFEEISKALNPEFVLAVAYLNKALDNMFIATADEDAIGRMESIVGIIPDEGDTLDIRRVRVQAKFSECLPYTDETLDERLTTLCGVDGYEIDRKYKQYQLDITTKLDNGNIFDTVIDTLDVIMPCNLDVTYKNLINTVSPLNLYIGGVSKVVENISVGCEFTHNLAATMPLTSGGASRVIEIIN